MESELSSSSERRVDGVGGDGESSSGGGFPDVLLIVVVLGDDGDSVGDEVGGEETDSELSDAPVEETKSKSLLRRQQLEKRRTRYQLPRRGRP